MDKTEQIRTVIVDDEAAARQLLRDDLGKHPEIEIVAECANGFEAIKAVSETDRLLRSGVRRPYVHRLRATLFQALGQPERAAQEIRSAAALEQR